MNKMKEGIIQGPPSPDIINYFRQQMYRSILATSPNLIVGVNPLNS